MTTKSRSYKDTPANEAGTLIQLFIDSKKRALQSAVFQKESDGYYTITLVWRE